ncbi:MAG: histidine kinase [Bacteroidota bacterium]|nr:histidine kinase [Bacteroidota bacterium]
MSKHRLYWICQILGWFLYSFINFLFFLLGDGKVETMQAISLLMVTGFFILSTHTFRFLVIKLGWLKLYISSLIPRVMVAITVLGILNYIFQWLISYLLGTLASTSYLSPFFILVNVFAMMVLYFLWSLIYFMYHYVESYNTSLKYDAAINEIKLNRLKSQLNPHFIFNALNSIRALVNENPDKAKVAITQLSNILRNSLVMDNQKVIKLNDELKTVKDYLDLEVMRFEERLHTEWDIQAESLNCLVPPLMVQTIVENGIKHGISNLIHGGTIRISTEMADSILKIKIRNSGQYLNGAVKENFGYGIANTKERLNLIYGNKASFSIINENEQHVLTEILIPIY